ncbi:MAG: pyridoxamine 5'-phosphate oxidase family protein [Microthrixaceae bacterium]
MLDNISLDECQALLRSNRVGRIAVVVDEFPVVLPVNYRIVETTGRETSARTWVALRTRPGNVIDRAPMNVAFEIDGIDAPRREGWSVLVRGTLHHVDPDAADYRDRFDPEPWLITEREAWLVIEPFAISGRRLRAEEPEWAFHPRAYL